MFFEKTVMIWHPWYCQAKNLIVAELAFSFALFLFTQAFTSGQSHYRKAPFSFFSATIFLLSVVVRGPSFHSSPVRWWPRWPRRGLEMNITFAAIRPSFALLLASSLTRDPFPFISFSSFSSATTNLFLIFFFRRDRKKRSREDLYLRHRDTCHEAKSFDSVSCCMLCCILFPFSSADALLRHFP